ncbi:MAG: hypothetical protein KGL73_05375 [Burkholderiales bacterium]|nr:hypothetical protein [Burkholderiales bacterium]
MQAPTDSLLLQFTLELASTERLAAAAAQLCADSGLRLQRLACAQDGQAYLYARLPARTQLDGDALPPLDAALGRRIPAARDIRVSRLQQVYAAPGHAQGEAPVFHYVVETDPEAGWQPELERWYDTEHMPGLAAVPGCILAQRYYNHDQGPYSLACYDLVSEQVLGSPPWLAVRGTAWSDIVRPHFTNTRRTMFRALA